MLYNKNFLTAQLNTLPVSQHINQIDIFMKKENSHETNSHLSGLSYHTKTVGLFRSAVSKPMVVLKTGCNNAVSTR